MYGTDVFDNLPTHLYLMAALHLIVACYFLKVSGAGNAFLSDFYTKTIILPRQARDKHEEKRYMPASCG